MKIQIAFDLLDINKSLEIARSIQKYVDRIEIGSSLLYKYGAASIEQFKNLLPDVELLVETQIIDRGKDLANICFDAGADWVTVMAGTHKQVIHAVCAAASNRNKRVMLDLLDTNLLGQSAMEAKNLGIDALLFHKSYDDKQPLVFADKWDMVKGNTNLPIFIASDFTKDSIEKITQLKPHGIVLGGVITNAEDPLYNAEFFYNKIKNITTNKNENNEISSINEESN